MGALSLGWGQGWDLDLGRCPVGVGVESGCIGKGKRQGALT